MGEGSWGSDRLRKAMAKFMTHHFKSLHPIHPDHVLIAAGVTGLMQMVAFTVFDEGDAVLTSTPCYQGLPVDFGMRAKSVPSSSLVDPCSDRNNKASDVSTFVSAV